MENLKRANVYIDESGDLGYKKGKTWFCITAVIVLEQDEMDIVKSIREVKKKMNFDTIHFVKVKEFGRKSYIVNELAKSKFVMISVITDTNELEVAKKSALLAHNYISRLLIERVSWYLRDNNLKGNVMFSARNSKRDQGLVDYVKGLLTRTDNQISSEYIGEVTYKKSSDWDMLQLADVCASSLFKAHEPDDYGFRYPCFISRLKDHFYSYSGKIKNYGYKYYPETEKRKDIKSVPTPCNLEEIKKELLEHVSHV